MCKRLALVAFCFSTIISYAQNVGIGTTTPGSGLELKGPGLGAQQRITDPASGNSLVLQGGPGESLKVTGYNYGTGSAKPLYLSVDGASTIINPNGGNVGIGTAAPLGGHLLDVAGPVISLAGISTHFVTQTTGGTNSWARFYMRTNNQSWFLGTSQNFNGNQLYLGDETFNITRLTIQPNGGPIYLQGQMTQDHGSYGLPKALVYLNANGTINRCYNGLNGATTSGCGLSVVRIGAGHYQVTFPFDISSRFFAVTAQQGCCPGLISVSYNVFGTTVMDIGVLYKDALIDDYRAYATDRPVMIVVY